MDFFKGIGNFFGGLFGGNKDDDERRRRQQQAQPKPQSQPQPAPTQGNGQGAGNWLDASPLTAQPFKPQNNMPIQQGQQNSLVSLVQNKPQPPKPTQPQPQLPPKPQPQPQLNKGVLDMEQSFKIKNNAPKPQPLTNITNSIPNYNVMSPEKQRQAIADVYDPPEARLARLSKKVEDDRKMRDGVKNFAEFIGNVPVVNTGANLSTWLASAAGELTGNKSLRDTADNTRNMINLGMTNQELNALPKGQRDKLSTVGNVASALSPLDVWGATSIAKAPIIGGVKQAAKEGIMSEAGKNILKQTAKETGKQYGTQIAIGAGAGGAIDPAIQAYVNDGKVDWSSVPNSMLQGGLWAAVLPEFSSKSRLTKSLHSRGSLVHEVEPNAPAIQENSPITPAGETPAQKPSGISTPNRPEGMNKAQNFPAKTEPQPVVTQPVPRPEPQPVQPQPVQPRPEPAYQTPPQTLQDAINDINDINDPLAPQRPVEPVQAPESPLQPIQRQLDEQMLEPPRPEVVTPPRVVETPAQVQARQVQELNATQPRLTPEQVADINAQKALADAPTEAMADLMSEARKYKSAEEFVRAQGSPLYHGSPNHQIIRKEGFKTNPNGNNLLGEGVYLTPHRTRAENYSIPSDLPQGATITQAMRDAGVIEGYTSKRTKIYEPASRAELQNISAKELQDKGYDGVSINGETVIFDSSKVKTREQLTDLYNQAHAKSAGWQNVVDDMKFGKNDDANANILLEKQQIMREVARVSRSDKELNDILNRAENLKRDGYLGNNANLVYDVSKNPAASRATVEKAEVLYNSIVKAPTEPKPVTKAQTNTPKQKPPVAGKTASPYSQLSDGEKAILEAGRTIDTGLDYSKDTDLNQFSKQELDFAMKEVVSKMDYGGAVTQKLNAAYDKVKAPKPTPQPKPEVAQAKAPTSKPTSELVASGEEAMNSISAKSEPAPVKAEPKPKPEAEVPQYSSPVRTNKTASVSGANSAKYNTGDGNLDNIVHDSIVAHKGVAKTAGDRADALKAAGITSKQQTQIRNIAVKTADKNTGRISEEGKRQIMDVLTGRAEQLGKRSKTEVLTLEENTQRKAFNEAASDPKPAPPAPKETGELGKVARGSVLDGSIKTEAGRAEVIRKTTALANEEAEAAGTTIDDIIRKGQETWEKSQLAGHDLTPAEVANGAKSKDGKLIKPVKGFTPEQQSIYKRYSQELSTVRDRTEVALKEGNQGEWYAPRQYLDDMGNSPEYNPDLINEMKRNTTAKTNSEGNPLDYSTRQHEDYLRRYMDAENAGTQRLVNAIENNADTGEATGVKLSDKAKTNVSEGMEKVIAKRDEGLKLQAEGDAKGAMKAQREVQREIDRTFKQLIRDVPAGPGRKEAVNQLKVLRGTYMQSTVQTFALSNIVNRVADQGARVLLGAQRPVTRLLEKAIAPMMDKKVMDGVEALTLNTSKNARKAAKEMTKGTLSNEIRDNFKANTALAGEGRNPLVKAMAKIDAYVRASGTSVTQSGDISTQVARRTLELGASRPEAKGLKTVDEYKRYFADYMNGKNFKADLASAEADLMTRIGLAGSEGDNMAHGGKFSRGVSKYLDNGVKTGVEALGQRFGVKGLGDKRIVQEVNDYWKVNGPGYAAVTSRVFGYVSNSLAGGVPKVLKAVKEAGKGDPAASARATQIAAQSISDAVAVYGTIGAAFILPKIAEGVIGFTGAQPTSGSSDSAHNKSEQVPANQWYLNLPGGDRLYIDPSRIGAPGVGANLAGGLQKGTAGDTAANTLGQMANQVGGESLPEKYNTFTTAFSDTTASESEREYARKRLGSMAVPAMGLSNNIANWMDDKKRDTAGFINTLKSRIPGLRQSVPVATDARGNEITNTKQVSGGSSLLSIGKNTESKEYKASDPVGAEIARLQRGDQDVFPTNANKNAKNKNTQDLARLLINDDVYKKADDKKKGEMMSSVLNGTDFKDVNTSISNEDKLAIMHAKQQGDKKKKWLENNDNAANYYRADYNNAKANNTLTDKDESLNEKSGKKYKMISAQVDRDFGADQELKRLYSAIGKSEIKNYFNHNSDMYDPELGERLLAFDQARTAKGVSRNSKFSDKPKYSSTTAKGGSGRRGGRSGGRSGSGSGSGGKARGYNMPTSLLSSKSNSAPDIKRGERLFKAPTLVSTAEKTKSRIPNISVKKGIHL